MCEGLICVLLTLTGLRLGTDFFPYWKWKWLFVFDSLVEQLILILNNTTALWMQILYIPESGYA
jgi:hypothetical protein